MFFSDDSTVIGHINKDATSMKLTSELDGMILATNDLTLTNKIGDVTVATINSTGTQFTGSISYSNPDILV